MQFNPLIPELSVADFAASLQFYTEVLGFKVEYDRPEHKFAFLSLDGAQLMLEEHNGNWETAPMEKPLGRGINFQIEVRNLEPILERLRAAQRPLGVDPRPDEYQVAGGARKQRQFLLQDPDGYLLRFCQAL